MPEPRAPSLPGHRRRGSYGDQLKPVAEEEEPRVMHGSAQDMPRGDALPRKPSFLGLRRFY